MEAGRGGGVLKYYNKDEKEIFQMTLFKNQVLSFSIGVTSSMNGIFFFNS